VVALVAAGGLLTGMVLGSAPGARPAAMRALGGLPELLRPDLVGLAQPAFPAPVLADLPGPDATGGGPPAISSLPIP